MEKPLFPGYLFVKLVLFQHYYKIRWMKGVARFVGWGDGPAPIAEGAVEVIRRRMDGQGKVRIGQDFKYGEKVRIKSGPLKDLIGVFESKVSARDRVLVLLHLVGYQASIQLHEALLERVG
jgi:transcription antitermination factor NusG